jgi:hypothetical protein
MATTIASTHATVLPQPKKVATAVGYTNADRASRSGIWIGIFAITMSFAAFTSALFVRQGTNDWTILSCLRCFTLTPLSCWLAAPRSNFLVGP